MRGSPRHLRAHSRFQNEENPGRKNPKGVRLIRGSLGVSTVEIKAKSSALEGGYNIGETGGTHTRGTRIGGGKKYSRIGIEQRTGDLENQPAAKMIIHPRAEKTPCTSTQSVERETWWRPQAGGARKGHRHKEKRRKGHRVQDKRTQ